MRHIWRLFQSTHPCGVRQAIDNHLQPGFVSIHAPVWGATRTHATGFGDLCFNPRTRVGCDQRVIFGLTATVVSIHAPVWGATKVYRVNLARPLFQSTHPCGVRLQREICASGGYGFNPRTRVGCDQRNIDRSYDLFVSIHAPVWGATYFPNCVFKICFVSIHAPVWGATKRIT